MLYQQAILPSLMKWRTRGSAAEDICLNVALQAMRREVGFETETALMSWAFITARRETLCLDAEILGRLEHEGPSEAAHPGGAKIEALQSCLEAAPESARRLLKLRYPDGYSGEQVVELMGLGLSAIYQRVSRLHESLKECVEGKLHGRDGSGESPTSSDD